VQAAEFEETSRRMMRFALDDLAALPDVPTVVEGPQILPNLVPQGDEAVFFDPTPEFQRAVLEWRSMPSSDPVRALANRLVKDRRYADRVVELARESGFPVVEVHGFPDLVAEVESLLEIRRAGRTYGPSAAGRTRPLPRTYGPGSLRRRLRKWSTAIRSRASAAAGAATSSSS
jgi:hypothetical protein